jgi:hypothetical protein
MVFLTDTIYIFSYIKDIASFFTGKTISQIFIVMSKNQILSLIRHTLTFVGGVLLTHGTIDESVMEQIIATTLSLVGLVWGVIEKKQGV